MFFRDSAPQSINDLTVFQRVPAPVPDVVADIDPKSDEHVYNYGRAHGKEGNINKVFANGSIGNTHFFTNIGANPKHLPFNKVLEFIHTAKL
jgi:hypothetical protein